MLISAISAGSGDPPTLDVKVDLTHIDKKGSAVTCCHVGIMLDVKLGYTHIDINC